MKKGLVSVVIPIYNVEKYLDRCLVSVVNQSYNNLEIILVDDASPDNCPQLCEQWAEKDKRIKVVHKANAGLGMARNTGIENATGEYICFFDSDDYIALDTIERCYQKASETDADVVCYGYHKVDTNGNLVSTIIPDPVKELFAGKEILDVFLPDMVAADPNGDRATNLWMSACGALFSMGAINKNNWRFVSEREIISEDVFSLLSFYRNVERAAVIKDAFYFYCENGASLTHVYRPDRYARIKHFYLESIKLCESLHYSEEVIYRLSRLFLDFAIAALKQEVYAHPTIKEGQAALKVIASDEVLLSVLAMGYSNHDGIARRILFAAIQHKRFDICCMLIKMQDMVRLIGGEINNGIKRICP